MNAIPPKRGSRLKATAPELIKPRKPKILIFGPSGVGKTTWSLAFPSCYLIDSEGGATQPEYRDKLISSGGVYLGPDDGASSFDVVMEQVKGLATESHTFRTLIIDSITKLFANEIAREGERLFDAGKKNEFGADKRPAVAYMRHLVNWLTRLDMNVILVAGEVPEWGQNDKGDRVEIGKRFDCWDRLEYELDLAIQVTKQGPTRIGRIRKSRIAAFPQGGSFPFTFDDFSERYGHETIEGAAQPVVLATEDQLSEFRRLVEVVKLEDGTLEKWLAAANVSSWEEADTDKVAKVIDHLKTKLGL